MIEKMIKEREREREREMGCERKRENKSKRKKEESFWQSNTGLGNSIRARASPANSIRTV